MVGLDTNVLVRLLYNDTGAPEQVSATRSLERRIIESNGRLYLTNVVLCETVWVMTKGYKVPDREMVRIIRQLLLNPYYILENPKRVESALDAAEANKLDFTDALIATGGKEANCRMTYTFDKKAAVFSAFSLLEVL